MPGSTAELPALKWTPPGAEGTGADGAAELPALKWTPPGAEGTGADGAAELPALKWTPPGADGTGADDNAVAGAEVASGPNREEPGLNHLVRGGLKWSFASTALGRLLTPLTSIILARLLAPEDFGVFSLAIVVGTALTSFNDLGVTNAIVRWQGDVRHAARTATSMAIGFSVMLYLLIFFVAPAFCAAMHTPAATGVIRLAALTVVIDGISSVPGGLLTREFRQGRRAAAEWTGFTVSTGLTVVLAASGFGAWSLAWGRIVGNTVNTVGLYAVVNYRPCPGWDRRIARDLLSIGMPLAASSLLFFAMVNTDYLVVGRVCGTVLLGLYTIAFNLSSWPSSIFSGTMRRVSVPTFSRLQDDRGRLERSFARGTHNLALLTIPLVVGLAVLSGPLVGTLYPHRYRPAAAALAFLAVLGGIRVLLDFTYDLFVALGKPRTLLMLQCAWGLALVPALVLGAHVDGIRGVAIGHVVVVCLVVVPAYLVVVRRAGFEHGPLVRPLVRPLVAGLVAGLAAFAVVRVVDDDGLVGLVAGGLTLLGVYLLLAMRVKHYPRFATHLLDLAAD